VVKINRETEINAMLSQFFQTFPRRRMSRRLHTLWCVRRIKSRSPRVLYISYGETDEWAHAGFIIRIWMQAHQVDAWIKRFGILFHDPQYRQSYSSFY
jgi:hypothetical protein